ncbi:Retrovirus-related Pol polyprotein from type-1 retrotransposable element R1 4 [Amphibalanus amphitrite]|uniref:Retrovirus-related Pol polyprotein from type-1 retrotransposable element R1 4 n=1 Tax=Amphibalanus amphitrite TaxID=1232801 RepID=A0A6A4W3R0_AMPAM|nr:Retrovirus-related Pol polyprotein from type-1 retrotransposable element R1 4 [Amphibalanus amphitrite]
MYADDTAALCAGNDITTAKRRAQRAADALVHWARQSKMLVAGEKTQLLVLSQSAADAADCAIKVDGKLVPAADRLKLLGVTLDRLLHFGAHCRSLRSRVRPRTQQLRKLTGRSWGLEERQLRAVASGYVGGALLHAAAAWLPATPQSHVELLEREMRAAARTITGCPLSTPAHAVMAEAGLMPVAARRDVLAAKLLARAHALPEGDPLRAVAEGGPPSRLKTVTGWRGVGHDTWRAAGIVLPIEPLLPARAPPWEVAACPHVTFSLDIGALRRDAPPDELHQAAQRHLASLPQQAIWVWTDGSADAGVRSGGAGAFVEWPDGATDELRVPAGQLCSSFRAEMVALRAALTHLRDHPHQPSAPITICSDSQSALATLREGPASQKTLLGAAIWTELAALAGPSRRIHLQWVPSHCGVDGNERADEIAKEAAALPQAAVPVDVATAHRAAARLARDRTIAAWPEGWYRTLMEDRLPPPAATGDRSSAVDVHQLRAGHWSGSRQYLHRIGRNPSDDCRQCPDTDCAAGLCTVCREEADTPRHFFFRCPALMGWRLRRYGTIFPNPEDVRDDGEVAALAAAVRDLQSRTATPQ